MERTLNHPYQDGEAVRIVLFEANDVHVVPEDREDIQVVLATKAGLNSADLNAAGQAIERASLVSRRARVRGDDTDRRVQLKSDMYPEGVTVTARIPQDARIWVTTRGSINVTERLVSPILTSHGGVISAEEITGDDSALYGTNGAEITVNSLSGTCRVDLHRASITASLDDPDAVRIQANGIPGSDEATLTGTRRAGTVEVESVGRFEVIDKTKIIDGPEATH